MGRTIPRAVHHVLPGAGHLTNLEKPEAFNEMVAEFLDAHLTIAAGEGALRPLKLQRSGRSIMTPEELLRGFALPKGTILP